MRGSAHTAGRHVVGRDWVARLLRRRARRALDGGGPFLFLCHGNICRSPFAERLAAKAFDGAVLGSAGHHATPGRASPRHAVAAAAEWDVDLSGHRATALRPEALDEATAVLVFDLRDVAAVARRRPRALRRTHLVGALGDDDGPVLVPDPYGGPPAAFATAYAEIARALAAWTSGASAARASSTNLP